MNKLWICYVWLQIITFIENVFSQYSMSMYSLQPAVDDLHRQDYPLNTAALTQDSNYPYEGAVGLPIDQYDWRSYENIGYKPTNRNNNQRNRWNKQLVKYIPSEIESDAENDHINRNTPWYFDPYGSYDIDTNENRLTEATKRSPLIPFQKHENLLDLSSPSASGTAFRERELLYKPVNTANTPNSYQMDLTDKFLKQIEKAEEQERQERYREDLQNLWHKYQQQENNKLAENLFHEEKRLRVPPYYMLMQKKRSYPVLPWLPYTANDMDSSKVFPLTKRSAKHTKPSNNQFDNLDNNNVNLDSKGTDNVENDFRELFGSMNIAKKKLGVEDGESEDNSTFSALPAASTASVEISMDMNVNHKNLSFGEELPKVSMSKSNDNDKKNWLGNMESKNSIGYMMNGQENHKADKMVYGGKSEDLTETPVRSYRRKKSIDWSQYFGIDRKRKSLEDHTGDHKHDSKRKENNLEESGEAIDLTNYKIDPIKLEKLRNKLRSIEDYIIRETVKYAGAHNGVQDLNEIEDVKDVVLTRLDTAYNLEKLRHVLDGISSKSLEGKNHLKYNTNANDLNSIQNMNNSTDLDSEKVDKNFGKLLTKNRNIKPREDSKERMQKKNGINNYSDVTNYIDDLDGFDMDSISPRHFDTNQCHIAEAILERCRAADALIMPGEGLNQKLMYLCGAHQVCYLCGGSRLSCDYQYVDDADNICNPYNKKCQRAVQILLIILRDMPLQNVGASECVRNICQNIALQDVVF